MEGQNKHSNIEAYLLGQLSETERRAFEQQLAAEPQLAQQLEQERKLLSGMEYFGQQQFKQELKAIHREVIEGKEAEPDLKPQGNKRWGRLLVAAAAIALALLLFWWLQREPATPQQLYAAHYEVFELPSSSRDADNAVALTQASDLYEKGQYQQALPLIENILQEQSDNLPLLLAAGNCQLQMGNPAAALPYFVRSLTGDDLLYRDQARWYAGLTQLQLGVPEAARAYLQPLADDASGDFSEEAKAILQQLKE